MVRCYYSTMVDVMVEAETREEALDAASGEINKEKYAQELLDNLQECGDNDVELIDHAHEVLYEEDSHGERNCICCNNPLCFLRGTLHGNPASVQEA